MAHHVVAIQTCSTRDSEGITVRLKAGAVYRSTDPIVRHRPDLFTPLDITTTVEQATKSPGEKRTTKRPAR